MLRVIEYFAKSLKCQEEMEKDLEAVELFIQKHRGNQLWFSLTVLYTALK